MPAKIPSSGRLGADSSLWVVLGDTNNWVKKSAESSCSSNKTHAGRRGNWTPLADCRPSFPSHGAFLKNGSARTQTFAGSAPNREDLLWLCVQKLLPLYTELQLPEVRAAFPNVKMCFKVETRLWMRIYRCVTEGVEWALGFNLLLGSHDILPPSLFCWAPESTSHVSVNLKHGEELIPPKKKEKQPNL